jgi:thymidine kinase
MSDEEKRGYYLKMNNKKPVLDPQVKVGAMDAYVRTTKKRAALF